MRRAHHIRLVNPAGVGLNDSVAVPIHSGNLGEYRMLDDAKTRDDDAIDHATITN